ncbi:MAG: disulfide bond formation protein DsbA [Piscirickettsiaceae bacterium]|nr:MAG: disulfide bond formation protein DsbA [Piscirickettsiaceae bacterium]
MGKLCFVILLMASLNGAALSAEAVAYDEGIDYQLITPTQPTDDPDRIEVVEVFWYGCPHCNHFEPSLGTWVKSIPSDVNFYRIPAIFAPAWEIHARAYFTAEILDVLDKSHAAFFHAIHVERKSLNTVDKLASFYANYGVDEDLFKKTYKSFVVNTQVSRAKDMINRYGITGVPAIVVEGKYLVTGPMAKSYQNMIKITDFLIAKERRAKK